MFVIVTRVLPMGLDQTGVRDISPRICIPVAADIVVYVTRITFRYHIPFDIKLSLAIA